MPAPSVLPGRANERISRKSRALFHWRAADLSLTAVTGETLALTRATGGTCRDAAGRLRTVSQYQPRWHYYDLDGDGVFETPGLMIEGLRINLCLQSEDFNTTWTDIGSVNMGAPLLLGDLTLRAINDFDGGVLGGKRQTGIVFTGDAVKAFSIFVGQGTSTTWRVDLVDTTAPANRLRAVGTWAGGLPVVSTAGGAGTYLGYEKWGVVAGVTIYRLFFQTTTVTAANAHRIDIYPACDLAGTVSLTGTLIAGGVQPENALFPSSYIKTTTATVTRNADSVLGAFAFSPRDLTMYARHTRGLYHGAFTDPSPHGITELGNGGGIVDRFYYDHSGGDVLSANVTAGSSPASLATVTAADPLEVLGQFKNHATLPAVAAALGDAALPAFTPGDTAVTAYSTAVIAVGVISVSGTPRYLDAALFELKFGSALLDTPSMRELF